MFLTGVSCALPSQKIVNDDILELIGYHSRGIYAGDIEALLLAIGSKLQRTAIVSRYWRSAKERPILLLEHACETALKQSNINRGDVDIVIYVGVDRGFAEPANACFVAKQLRMNSVRTFDVADACHGWSTATEIAQALFATNKGAAALIVSAEFPMRPGGAVLPECFTIAADAELDWKFPAFTLGEAATASIVIRGGPSWRYVHESHNELADLCTVGLGPSYEYAGASERFGSPTNYGFRAYGSDLATHIYRPAIRVLRELLVNDNSPRILFPHSVIGPYVDQVAARVSSRLKVFSTFTEMGNIATSSLPSCFWRARQRGILNADDLPIAWAAASGLKVSAFEIVQQLGRDQMSENGDRGGQQNGEHHL